MSNIPLLLVCLTMIIFSFISRYDFDYLTHFQIIEIHVPQQFKEPSTAKIQSLDGTSGKTSRLEFLLTVE